MPRPNARYARIPHEIIRCGSKLTAGEFRVLLNIVSWIDDDADEGWVYLRTLAEGQRKETNDNGAGMSLRQVRRTVRSLERKGVLSIEGDKRRANRFRIHWGFFGGLDNKDTDVRTTDTDDRNLRTSATGESGHSRPDNTDAGVRREKTLRNNHENKPSSTVVEERAKQIFSLYPRKIGEYQALKEIKQALHRVQQKFADEPDPFAFLLSRTQQFARSPAGKKGQYTPYPSTFFRDDRWAENPKEWFANGNHRPADIQRVEAASFQMGQSTDELAAELQQRRVAGV